MTTLALIRHGQASFGQANYDELSPLGERQARITGRHLAHIGARFDILLSGEMARQRRTAELAAEAWEEEEQAELQTHASFNEYDAYGLFQAYLPAVLNENAELAARQRELFQDRKLFQQIFEAVTAKWLAGETHDVDGFEAWEAFSDRVHGGLAGLHRDYHRDARIALVTSGGPISVAVASALGLSPEQTLRLNWTVYNTSITELRSTRHGWRLMSFNNITHLQLKRDPAVITLR